MVKNRCRITKLVWGVSFLLTLLLFSCSTEKIDRRKNISIVPSEVTFPSPGATIEVKLFYSYREVTDFTLSSLDPDIVRTNKHLLIAVAPGKTRVVVKWKKFTGHIPVTVKENLTLKRLYIKPEIMEFTKWSHYSFETSGVDESGNIFYGLAGSFSSDNNLIASVDRGGNVKIGVMNGKTRVTFYCCGRSADAEIIVKLPVDAPYAGKVVNYSTGISGDFGLEYFPQNVLGPPRGGNPVQSSPEELLSLGNGGEITLEFANYVTDGPGIDFIVFENPLKSGNSVFTETAFVEVSQDGKKFMRFPADYNPDGPGGVGNPENYRNLAGVHPVYANPPTISATDPGVAGGDQFDLSQINLKWIRYIRIIDTGFNSKDKDGDTIDDAGNHFPCGPNKCGFDLDAVSIVYSGHIPPP